MPKKTPPSPPPLRASKPTPAERIPRVIDAPSLGDHLEVMTRAIFQAGLSWALIAARWDAFRAAFDAFNITAVAMYGEGDVERIMSAEGVIHSRSKIAGTIANARALVALAAEHGDIATYARSFASYDALYADAKGRFVYLGDLSCYYWLFRTELPVPPFERWMEHQSRDHPRMREMIALARSENRSSETRV
jgi:hypothetical protein